MTSPITPEQALKITDLESYKEVTGSKRFKRDADEMQRGLTPDEALSERLSAALQANPPDYNKAAQMEDEAEAGVAQWPSVVTKVKLRGGVRGGEIVIRIRPERGVDSDYFEKLPNTEIVVNESESFYGWLDTWLDNPYTDKVELFFKHVLDLGLGEVITRIHTEQDIEDRERPIKHPSEVSPT